ncbi:hypothetical protein YASMINEVIRUS_144 [Yasminevirus sp. GU-2018]|uniref:Uncharacterized protein n=1 Tax=Yasminevirus sp. GU-2018 TaxID=2420051 RepID=A0A5K0U850_9VIRU|nr:hypothetical protein YASMINEVIRUS_144 [Yasminevirus sp. GU-2018]
MSRGSSIESCNLFVKNTTQLCAKFGTHTVSSCFFRFTEDLHPNLYSKKCVPSSIVPTSISFPTSKDFSTTLTVPENGKSYYDFALNILVPGSMVIKIGDLLIKKVILQMMKIDSVLKTEKQNIFVKFGITCSAIDGVVKFAGCDQQPTLKKSEPYFNNLCFYPLLNGKYVKFDELSKVPQNYFDLEIINSNSRTAPVQLWSITWTIYHLVDGKYYILDPETIRRVGNISYCTNNGTPFYVSNIGVRAPLIANEGEIALEKDIPYDEKAVHDDLTVYVKPVIENCAELFENERCSLIQRLTLLENFEKTLGIIRTTLTSTNLCKKTTKIENVSACVKDFFETVQDNLGPINDTEIINEYLNYLKKYNNGYDNMMCSDIEPFYKWVHNYTNRKVENVPQDGTLISDKTTLANDSDKNPKAVHPEESSNPINTTSLIPNKLEAISVPDDRLPRSTEDIDTSVLADLNATMDEEHVDESATIKVITTVSNQKLN